MNVLPEGVRETLIEQSEIEERVETLAKEISSDYADSEELLLVGILRGAFIFLADLARRLTVPHEVDFMALASYDGAERGGIRLIMDTRENVRDRDVVIVEDIVDSGHTMTYLLETLASRHPRSLACCTLLRKPSRLEVEVPVDYLGFDIPDEWVVGYGLDYENRHRALPYIGIVEPRE